MKQVLIVLVILAAVIPAAAVSRAARQADTQERLNDCLADHPAWAREFHSRSTSHDDKSAIVDGCLGGEAAQ